MTRCRRLYRFSTVTLSVECDDAAILDFFEADTGPFIEPLRVSAGQDAVPDVMVTVESGSASAAPPPAHAVPLLLHRRDTPLNGWTWHTGNVSYVSNPHHPGRYRIEGSGRISICYSGGIFNAYVGLRLTLFPLLYRLSDKRGTVSVHASAVAAPGGGLLFCGAKGAGKTSIAVTLALVSGYGFVTNDYAVLSQGTESAEIIGVPEPTRVADGTYNAMRESLRWSERTNIVLGKRYLHIRHARHHLRLVPRAALRAIYFPALTTGSSTLTRQIPAEEAAALLASEAMESSGYQTPMLVDVGPAVPDADIRKRLRAWAADVPCFRLEIPRDLIGTQRVAAELAETCARAPATPAEQRGVPLAARAGEARMAQAAKHNLTGPGA